VVCNRGLSSMDIQQMVESPIRVTLYWLIWQTKGLEPWLA
jgi:hypothetical protein